jgi:hypothetical protein
MIKDKSWKILIQISFKINLTIKINRKKFFNKNFACKRKILRKKIMTGIMIYMRIEFLKIFK